MTKINKTNFIEPLVNNEIVGYNEVRCIYNEFSNKNSVNDFNRVMSLKEAKNIAAEKNLDLVEVNLQSNPPIVRICDYSKFLYEKKKQLKNKQKNIPSIKEVQLSANISLHDLQVKANKATEFIKNGHKVKVILTLKGREMVRQEENKKSLFEFITLLEEVAIPESMPKDDKNKSIVILKSKK